MAEKTRDPQISAIEAIYSALKALDPASRRKVLASVSALLRGESLSLNPGVNSAIRMHAIR